MITTPPPTALHCLSSSIRGVLAVVIAAACVAAPARETDKKDFSVAERELLMSDQLAKLKPPRQLVYDFKHSGSLDAGFDDKVTLRLKAKPDGKGCCIVDAEFLTGERKLDLSPIEDAAGNPVTLYFLEHDIREMKRLTKGSTNYFRKRIRMALYESARVDDVSFAYDGKTVTGRQFVVEPYRDDPNRARFENLVRKQYVFTLSPAVPGEVAAIRTVVHPAGPGDAAVVKEDMVLRGVTPPPIPAMKPFDAAPATPPAAPDPASSPSR
jgi:hypothetical protein